MELRLHQSNIVFRLSVVTNMLGQPLPVVLPYDFVYQALCLIHHQCPLGHLWKNCHSLHWDTVDSLVHSPSLDQLCAARPVHHWHGVLAAAPFWSSILRQYPLHLACRAQPSHSGRVRLAVVKHDLQAGVPANHPSQKCLNTSPLAFLCRLLLLETSVLSLLSAPAALAHLWRGGSAGCGPPGVFWQTVQCYHLVSSMIVLSCDVIMWDDNTPFLLFLRTSLSLDGQNYRLKG
jgi:hypothetical protein